MKCEEFFIKWSNSLGSTFSSIEDIDKKNDYFIYRESFCTQSLEDSRSITSPNSVIELD